MGFVGSCFELSTGVADPELCSAMELRVGTLLTSCDAASVLAGAVLRRVNTFMIESMSFCD